MFLFTCYNKTNRKIGIGNDMKLIRYPQENSSTELQQEILRLEGTAWPTDDKEEIFPSAPDTYVTSFILLDYRQVICHVGVRKKAITHRGIDYLAYGLSEVVTHPDYQQQGFGTSLIQKAADFILSEKPDISIFTCKPNYVKFYTNGGWQVSNNACLVGGTKQAPFRSDDLGLVTMIRFISNKSILHQQDFENTDIVLELGMNQLW